MLNVLSLFSGIGGIDLGLERAGMTVVGQVEIDQYCQQVLAKHWPHVPRHDDVHTAAAWWLSEERPHVDLIAGGFPCQPVSLAGRQRGQADERWLWPAMADVIRQLRPGWVLLENVPGLLVRGIGDVLGDLAACGYDAEWDCVPAAAVGAHHRRDRVWIVAYPNGEARRPEAGHALAGPGGRAVLAGQAAPGGCGRDVADAPGQRRGTRRAGGSAGHGADRPGVPAPGLADTDSQRRDDRIGPGEIEARGGRPPRIFLAQPPHRSRWSAEPDVGRVAHGVPGRVDRLRALGNAVVPQVTEHVGRLILAAHQREVASC